MAEVVTVKEIEGEKITITEIHVFKKTYLYYIIWIGILTSVMVGYGISITSDQTLQKIYSLMLILCGVAVFLVQLVFGIGEKHVPAYYIRSFYDCETIIKTGNDQKAICEAVRRIEKNTVDALRIRKENIIALQDIVNNCK